ncbi:TPA: sigma factor-like helix-turn-helix DNA-binding protein [Raoultella ornithinolytica]|nr:hypothetical protein [Raoultella ornithinolytica]
MCAMDRSSDNALSQSVRDALFHIKALYHSSPVSVCVRNQQRDILYSNISFKHLYDFFKAEGDGNSFSGSFIELELMLYQLELDCMALGRGCVLSKIFSCGSSNFQVRMKCINTQDDEIYIFWQVNLLIVAPLSSRKFKSVDADALCDLDKVMVEITDLNIVPLSFYVLGFSYSDISRYLDIPERTVKKRIERSKAKVAVIYPSFSEFVADCYRTRKVYFFTENVYEFVMLK